MAEEKKTKKVKNTDYSTKTLAELKDSLSKVVMDTKSGKEKNTSLIKKIKKEIARKLTIKK